MAVDETWKTVVVDFTEILEKFEASVEWRRYYPRIYENVGAYNPKVLAAGLFCSALNVDVARKRATDFETIHYPTTCLLLEHGIPQYFVGKELAASLLKTDIPDDMPLIDLQWPFPAVAFQLPQGVLTHKEEGSLDVIMVSIIRPGRYGIPNSKGLTGRGYATIDVLPDSYVTLAVSTFMRESANFVSYRASVPLDKFKTFGEAYAFLRDGAFRTSNFDKDAISDAVFQPAGEFVRDVPEPIALDASDAFTELKPTTVDDAMFNLEMFRLGLNLLLTMENEPALVEPAQRLKTVKAKKPHLPPKEFWQPNFVGRHYRVKRDWQGGTHASPRIHWRRGHWRSSRTGPMTLPKDQRPTVRHRIPAKLINADQSSTE